MTLDEWRVAGAEFCHRGHRVFYRDGGVGEPLLLLHGYPTASADWRRVWPGLTGQYRVLAADMLGFGFSDKPIDYHYSVFDQASMIENWIEHLGVGRAHVLAHDLGDTLAQELLARHLARSATDRAGLEIASLTFLNGGLFPESHRALPLLRVLASPVGDWIAWAIGEAAFSRSYAGVFGEATRPSVTDTAEAWSLVRGGGGLAIQRRLLGYFEERWRYRGRWVDALVRTHVPLLLVSGAADPVAGVASAERFREVVPRAKVVSLDGVGHYPQIEAPARVLDAYADFRDVVAERAA